MAASVTHLSSDGATVISALTLATAVAGVNQTPVKLGFRNSGNRQLNNVSVTIAAVGSNDGNLEAQTAADSATLSAPWNLAAVLGAVGSGGLWGSTGVKGFVVTAYNALGETIASAEVTVNVDDTTKKVTLTWTAVPSASGYKVYDTDTAGTYTSPSLRATVVGGSTTTYTDLGGTRSTGAPPVDNRTAGWLTTLVLSGSGAGGVWGATGVYYWRVVALDSTGSILAASLEATVNVDVASKTVTVSWTAIAGAATYSVYRSTVSGTYTSPALVASGIAGTSYVDTGTAVTTGSLTWSASYGSPPASGSFGTAALMVGNIAVGQYVFYWINRVVLSNTPESGNPRQASIVVQEN